MNNPTNHDIERLRAQIARLQQTSERRRQEADRLRARVRDLESYTPPMVAAAQIARFAAMGEDFLTQAQPQVESAFSKAQSLAACGTPVDAIVAAIGAPSLCLAGILTDDPRILASALGTASGQMLIALVRARRGDLSVRAFAAEGERS